MTTLINLGWRMDKTTGITHYYNTHAGSRLAVSACFNPALVTNLQPGAGPLKCGACVALIGTIASDRIHDELQKVKRRQPAQIHKHD